MRISDWSSDVCSSDLSSPRPATVHLSGDPVGLTESATSVSSSLVRRSLKLREVVYFPSFPINGDVFTPNVILMVGSSILIIGTIGRASCRERVCQYV